MNLHDWLSSYVLAWLAYLVSAVLAQLVFWRMVRKLRPRALQLFLRALLAVILFTPVYSQARPDWLVPAWLYGGYDLILGQTRHASQALTNLAVAGIVMLLVWIIAVLHARKKAR